MHGRALLAATTKQEGAGTAEELLRANVVAFFEFVREHRSAWRMLFLDPAPDPDIAAAHRELQTAATERLAAVIVARVPGLAVSADIPRADADRLIAQAGKSALNGLAIWWWDHPALTVDVLAAVAMDLLWGGLGDLSTDPDPGAG
jgi:hypothetical protein